jgi:hypothetical protein
MADEQKVKQLQDRIDHDEELVISPVPDKQSVNESLTTTTATKTCIDTINDLQSASATTSNASEELFPHLMRLPPELRLDILERFLQPAFAARPYGLTLWPLASATTYAIRRRYPAVLRVNQIIRAESIRVFLNMAQASMLKLEIKIEDLRRKLEALQNDGLPFNRMPACKEWLSMENMGDEIMRVQGSMAKLDSTCRVLGGEPKRR